MITPRTALTLVAGVLLAACDKTAVQVITGPADGAHIKFFNFGVGAPGVNFYANTTKLTAISSTTGSESTLGTNYGSAGSGGRYAAIPAGAYSLEGKIAAATDKDLAIAKATATLAQGKSYSYYISGIYNTTAKTADAFVIEDAIPSAFDFTATTVRFVNAISNSNPMILYARHTVTGAEVAIGTAVAYKSGGAFITIPPGVYDLFARAPGSTTNLITRTAVSFVIGNVYTVGARGDMTVTSTTAATRPQFDNTPNR
jgi:hypothetical protein